MRKKYVKQMLAGMLVLLFVTGCGANDKEVKQEPGSDRPVNQEESFFKAEKSESRTEINDSKTTNSRSEFEKENPPDHRGSAEHTGNAGNTEHTGNTEHAGNTENREDMEGIEEELAAFRAEREKGTTKLGKKYTMVVVPDEENYKYAVGDSNYTSGFDSKELNEAFKTADTYLKNTLQLESGIWPCIDPRMTAIYEDDDKGVASGYTAENIFLCEYEDNGNWQYLILVREGKDSAWKVIYHGNSYKIK